MLASRDELRKWQYLVQVLYLERDPTRVDVEMACCEFNKYKTAIAWAAGASDVRPKAYFDGDATLKLISMVPVCRRRQMMTGRQARTSKTSWRP